MSFQPTKITDLQSYDPQVDPEPIDEISVMVDHPNWAEPKKAPYSSAAVQESIIVGSQLVQSTGWTSTGWTGDYATGFKHTAGNTSALSNTIAAILEKTYQIYVGCSERTAGSFTVEFGGEITPALISSSQFGVTPSTNGNLIITPTSDFDGRITIQIKQVEWELSEAEILAILGVPDVVSSSVLSGYVQTEAGKSLLADSEIARLLTLKQNVYTLSLVASDEVSGRISGATLPSGWSIAAVDGTDLEITHNLTGRKIAAINVFTVDAGVDRWLPNGSTAYAGFTATGLTVTIEGLTNIDLPLRIELIFA